MASAAIDLDDDFITEDDAAAKVVFTAATIEYTDELIALVKNHYFTTPEVYMELVMGTDHTLIKSLYNNLKAIKVIPAYQSEMDGDQSMAYEILTEYQKLCDKLEAGSFEVEDESKTRAAIRNFIKVWSKEIQCYASSPKQYQFFKTLIEKSKELLTIASPFIKRSDYEIISEIHKKLTTILLTCKGKKQSAALLRLDFSNMIIASLTEIESLEDLELCIFIFEGFLAKNYKELLAGLRVTIANHVFTLGNGRCFVFDSSICAIYSAIQAKISELLREEELTLTSPKVKDSRLCEIMKEKFTPADVLMGSFHNVLHLAGSGASLESIRHQFAIEMNLYINEKINSLAELKDFVTLFENFLRHDEAWVLLGTSYSINNYTLTFSNGRNFIVGKSMRSIYSTIKDKTLTLLEREGVTADFGASRLYQILAMHMGSNFSGAFAALFGVGEPAETASMRRFRAIQARPARSSRSEAIPAM